MLILKIPILYLIGVVWYAIKAEPRPEEPAIVREENRPGPRAPETGSRVRQRPRPSGPPAAAPPGPSAHRGRPRGARPVSETAAEQGATRPAETVAGFIAAAALAVGVIAIYYEPVKLAVPALIVALIAVAHRRPVPPPRVRRRRRDQHRLGARDDLRGHRGQPPLVARHQGLSPHC